MKKIFKIISVLSVLVIMLTTSCSEKERTWLADLMVGAYMQFIEVPDALQAINSIAELNYEGTLVDPTGNVVQYDLYLSATLGGADTDEILIDSYTTFPINLAFTAADFATLLGVTVGDINFGDEFFFRGVVTHANGTIYGGEPPDIVDGEPVPNGRTNDVVTQAGVGYRQAFTFGFIIGCPGNIYNSATIPGDWHAFSASWPADGTVTITLDPADENILLVDGMPELDGMVGDTGNQMHMVIDPADNSVWIDPSYVLATNFYGYDNMYLTGGGTIFPCAGDVIRASVGYRVDQGSFGNYAYVFTPL